MITAAFQLNPIALNFMFKLFKLRCFVICSVFALLALSGCATKTGVDAFKQDSAQKILRDAKIDLHKHNYTSAIQHFEALESLYPFSAECEQGQLAVIYAYYQNNDFNSAAVAAEHYIHLYPRGKNVAYAYYMKGLSNYESSATWIQKKIYHSDPAEHDLRNIRQAFNDFSTLIQLYPTSKYVQDARQRMLFIRDVIAQHEIDVAKFYMQRGAYVAAANRASYVVRHFEGSPQVRSALKIMISAYQKLGATVQMQRTQRILAGSGNN